MDETDDTDLLAAGMVGRVLDLGTDGRRGSVDASVLRRCCHELKDQIDPRGIRLRNAVIVGIVDLAGLEVPFPLRFEDCEFDSPLLIESAQLHELALTGCARVPGVLANGVRIRRDLDLSGSWVTGALNTSASTSKQAAIWLCESDIGGRLLCVDTVIDGGGERSIQADRMHVSGTIRLLHQFTSRAEIRLIGARIEGSLDLTGALIETNSASGLALDLGEAVIDGSIFVVPDQRSGRRPLIRGWIDMGGARVGGQFLIRNATLLAQHAMTTDFYTRSGVEGAALSAPRLSVGAEVTLDSCEVFGGVDLAMSDMSSMSIGANCVLSTPGHTALDLTNAEIRSLLRVDEDAVVEGTLRLAGAVIHGTLALHGQMSQPEHLSLIGGSAMTVDGNVYLNGLRTHGGRVNFRGASLGSLSAGGAQLENRSRSSLPDNHDETGCTLAADGAKVAGNVLLNEGFVSAGALRLAGADIAGSLICADAQLDGCDENGYALVADEIRVGGSMMLNEGFTASGAVRLPGANIARNLVCSGAQLSGQDDQGVALRGGGIKVASIYLNDGFTAAGMIWLESATISGSAYLAPQKPPDGITGLDAAHAQIAGTLSWIPLAQVEGPVSLQGATADQLVDDWGSARNNAFWPTDGRLHLDGFIYSRLGGAEPATVDQRLGWLRSQYEQNASKIPAPFAAQPYEQLASVYRHAGQDTEARRVAIARRSDLRKYGNLSPPRRIGNWLLDKSIKYGYQTWRAVAGLISLYVIVLALSIFAQHHGLIVPVGNVTNLHPTPVATRCVGNYPCFYPAGYAIDTVIPIINVHQAAYWGPSGHTSWAWIWVLTTWIATALGWALVTLLVAGYTGLARRE
jgi:hypothetical protein